MWIRERVKSLKISHAIIIIIVIYNLVAICVWIMNPSAPNALFSLGLPAPMKTLTAKHALFSLAYPQTWTAFETPQGSHGDKETVASISRTGRSLPQVTIARRQFQENEGIKEVAIWGQIRAQNETNYTFISIEGLDSDNYKGILHEYSWGNTTPIEMYLRHCEDWYVFSGNTGYSLSFCVDDKDWLYVKEVFQEMIQSFTIIGD